MISYNKFISRSKAGTDIVYTTEPEADLKGITFHSLFWLETLTVDIFGALSSTCHDFVVHTHILAERDMYQQPIHTVEIQ